MDESLKALLDLQAVDVARDRLEERKVHLPEKAELAEIEGRIADMRAAIDRVREEQDAIIREVDRQEGEMRIIEEKIAREEGKLYSGAVVNPKELSALQDEIGMLKRRRAPIEDAVIEQLVVRDDLLAERERIEAELAELEREAQQVRDRIAELTGEIDRDLQAEQEKRDAIVPQIPEDVIELYETLRPQKRGVGVGALEGGICTACREALSAVEVDRIRRQAREGERRFRCEHCRRILVVQ